MGRSASGKRSGARRARRTNKVVAVDLFCGVGGLTRGLERSGIKVKLGIDIDPDCEFPLTWRFGVIKQRPDIGTTMPAGLTDKLRLQIGQADAIGPAVGAEGDGSGEGWIL